MKKLLFSNISVNKGLIQHVVQSCYNYNLTFRKIDIHTVKTAAALIVSMRRSRVDPLRTQEHAFANTRAHEHNLLNCIQDDDKYFAG